MTIEEFKQQIKAATTEEELRKIRFQAFRQDASPIDAMSSFSVKPKTLSEQISRLTTKRLHELGLIEDAAYIPTDDNGNYIDKKRLAAEKADFYNSMRELFAKYPDV